MFDLMGMGMTKPKQQEVDLNNLLGFDTFPAASPVVVPTSTNNTNLFGDDLLKFNLSTNPTPNNGFNSFPQPEAKNDFGINLLGNPSPTVSLSSQPKMPAQSAPINPNKILAY